jgi:hypothetical protein
MTLTLLLTTLLLTTLLLTTLLLTPLSLVLQHIFRFRTKSKHLFGMFDKSKYDVLVYNFSFYYMGTPDP